MQQELIERAKQVDLAQLMGVSLERPYRRVSRTSGGEWAGPCPVCGQGKDAFHIKPDEGVWMCGYCTGRGVWQDSIDYVCRQGLSFREAVERLAGDSVAYAPAPRRQAVKPKPQGPQWWQTKTQWLGAATQAPDRFAAWQQHKPLTGDSIERYQLGVGHQPGISAETCPHRRLLIPVFDERRRLTHIRGRAFEEGCQAQCAKWLTSGAGVKLFNLEEVQPGDMVLWVENNVDAILMGQDDIMLRYLQRLAPESQRCVGVASVHGGGAWRGIPELLAARQPARVIVALDNDHVGNPSVTMKARIEEEYRARGVAVPAPNGPQIADALSALGVPVTLWEWSNHHRKGADMGGFYIDTRRRLGVQP